MTAPVDEFAANQAVQRAAIPIPQRPPFPAAKGARGERCERFSVFGSGRHDAWSVWSGFSWAIFSAASFRSSSYTIAIYCSEANGSLASILPRISVTSHMAMLAKRETVDRGRLYHAARSAPATVPPRCSYGDLAWRCQRREATVSQKGSLVTGLGRLHSSHFCPATQHRHPYASAGAYVPASSKGWFDGTRYQLREGHYESHVRRREARRSPLAIRRSRTMPSYGNGRQFTTRSSRRGLARMAHCARSLPRGQREFPPGPQTAARGAW